MTGLRTVLGRRHPPRVALVAAELARFRRPRYLEIGVHTGVVFLHVRAARKVAVDPLPRIPRWKLFAHPNTLVRGSLFRATSDEFFAALAPRARFDLVFVDGDHRFEPSLRDVERALEHLAPDGVVMVHDCSPPTAAAASPDSADSAGGPWCGEVWRTIVHLRATREDLDVEVLDTDFGVAMIRRREPAPAPLAGVDAAGLGFAELDADRRRLLGLRG